MLILNEQGYLPEEIKIVPDWQVLAACALGHLATLCWLAWRVGTTLGRIYP